MNGRKKTAAIVMALGVIVLAIGIIFFVMISTRVNALAAGGTAPTEQEFKEWLNFIDEARAEGFPTGISAFESAMIRMGFWGRYVFTGVGALLTLIGLGMMSLGGKKSDPGVSSRVDPTPKPIPKPEPVGRYCPCCNTLIEPGNRFCVVCGTSLSGETRSEPKPVPKPVRSVSSEIITSGTAGEIRPERRSKNSHMKRSGDF